MLRGTKIFICDQCGCRFTAPDIEMAATMLSVPQPCPKCGSKHTYPCTMTSFLGKYDPQRHVYKKIW